MPELSSSSLGERGLSQHQVAEWRRLLDVHQPAAEQLQDGQKCRDDLVDGTTGDGTERHARRRPQRVQNARSALVHARAHYAWELDLRLARFKGKAAPPRQPRFGLEWCQ